MTPVTTTSPCLFPFSPLLSPPFPLHTLETGKPWDVREMAVACLSSITWALLVSDAAYPEPPLLNHSTMKTDDSDVNVTMYRRAHQAACEAITSALHRRAKDAPGFSSEHIETLLVYCAWATTPEASATSVSSVGLPRLSRISRARMSAMSMGSQSAITVAGAARRLYSCL